MKKKFAKPISIKNQNSKTNPDIINVNRFNRRTFLGKFVSLLAAIQLIPTSVIKIKNSFKRFIKENESEKTWIFTPDEVEIYLPENADQGIIWGCRDFIKDCQEATGKKPEIINTLSGRGKLVILPAVVDGNNQLNRFEKTGLIDLSKVRGNWESYVIQPITDLGKNNPNILVVAGSVPRAVAYGLYEISYK